MKDTPSILRLRKRHGQGIARTAKAADGERIVRAQSPTGALIAAVIAIAIFCILWVALTALLDRVLPWLTLLLGVMVGFAVQWAGRGVDPLYPLLAACLALVGAVCANIVVAASTTAVLFDTGTLQILRAVTGMTWPVFFEEVFTAADAFYAAFAAALAAFLANRRLSRTQYYALRLWRQQSDGHQ